MGQLEPRPKCTCSDTTLTGITYLTRYSSVITLKQHAVNTNTIATNVFKFILLFFFYLFSVENMIFYFVLIFAQIRAEKLNAQN